MYHILFCITEIVYLITVLGVIVVIISENRNPIKTITWIMVLIFLPIIGFVIYIIFGQDYTKRRFMSKRMYSKIKTRPLAEINSAECFTILQNTLSILVKLLRILTKHICCMELCRVLYN